MLVLKFLRSKEMRRILSYLAVALLLTGLVPTAALTVGNKEGTAVASSAPSGEYVPGQLIVKFRDDIVSAAKAGVLGASGATVAEVSDGGAMLLELPEGTDAHAAAANMEKSPIIEYAEPNYIVTIASQAAPDVILPPEREPEFIKQWGLPRVNAPQAWDIFLKDPGSNVIVAVLDTGVDASHEELNDGRVLSGRNFTGIGAPTSTIDIHGHGTHVAGIIAAEINYIGIAGIIGNADIDILPVKVLNDDARGTWFGIAEGIRYAVDRGAQILNLSLGGPNYSHTLADAVLYAQGKGALIVAAAGNDMRGPVGYPAALPGVLTVSATHVRGSQNGYEDVLASFSNIGPEVDIAAPGYLILSTIPWNEYDFWSGTSMAAPKVAGAAALLMASNAELTALDVEQLLKYNAKDIGVTGFDIEFGFGLLDVFASLNAAMVPNIEPVEISWIYPEPNMRLWGVETLDIGSSSAYVARVEVSVLDNEQNEKFTGYATSTTDLVYSIEWDTGSVVDGNYTLVATAYDAYNENVGEARVNISVVNDFGIRAKVRTPMEIAPERGRVHLYKVLGSEKYQYVESLSIGREGRIAFDEGIEEGEKYVLIIESYGPYDLQYPQKHRMAMYVREVTAPFNGVIGRDENVKEVTFEGISAAAGHLNSALIVLQTSFQSELSDPIVTSLDSLGKATIWLDEGTYELTLFNDSPGYLIIDEDFIVNADITHHFDTENVGSINLEKTLVFGEDLYYESWFDEGAEILVNPVDSDLVFDFPEGQPIFLTPGDYSLGLRQFTLSANDDAFRHIFWKMESQLIQKEQKFNYQVGGEIISNLVLRSYKFKDGETLYTDNFFVDEHQNRITDVSFLPSIWISEFSLTDQSFSLRRDNENGKTDEYVYDVKTGQLQLIDALNRIYIYPVLMITDEEGSVVYKSEVSESDELNPFESSSVLLESNYFLPGTYNAGLSADLGPFGIVESEQVQFDVISQEDITLPTSATIDPSDIDFDLYKDEDIFTIITWNDATKVTSVVYGEDTLVLDTDYTVTDKENGTSTLTISGDVIEGYELEEGDLIWFQISFDIGCPQYLNISITDSTPESPAPPATPPAPPATPPVPPAPPVVEQPIVEDATTVVALEGKVEVTIAAGAIKGEAPKIKAEVLQQAEAEVLIEEAVAAGIIPVGEVIVLTVSGGEFTAPVQLNFNFDTAKIPTGQVPSVFVYNERTKRWIYLGGEIGNGKISLSVDRFSKFGVFATKPLPALTDIKDHWARKTITTMAGMDIIEGFHDGSFKPNANLTRAQFTAMLSRALGLKAKPDAAARFKDAAELGWAKGVIGAVSDIGLVTGFPDGRFGWQNPITRAEVAVILERVITRRLIPVKFSASAGFADEGNFPDWARTGVLTASQAGLVRGFPDNSFRHDRLVTRAEISAVLYRLIAER